MPHLRHILSVCMVAVCCFAAVAENFTIRGRVTDQNGDAIEGATVKVSPGFPGTMTKANGEYIIVCSVSDTVTVTYSCISYQPRSRKIIEPHGELIINMRLTPAEKELEEVEVVDVRKRTGAMESMGVHDYKRRGADPTGGSIESMLATMPGVAGATELSGQYSVRGGSYDENAVYLNGFEITRPQLISSSAQEGLSILNPEMTKSVEFSTGGFGAQYTDRMSSVLDVTYRRPQSTEGMLSMSFMGAEAALGSGNRKFAQLHGVRYRKNSSILSTTDTKGEYDPDFFDWQSYIVVNPTEKFKITLLGDVNIANYRFKPTDRETNFGTLNDAKRFKVYFDGHEKDRFTTLFGGIGLDWSPARNSTVSLQVSAYGGDELVAYDIAGEYWLDQAGTSGGTIGGELGVGRYRDHARNRLKSHIINAAMRGITAIKSHSLTYGIAIKSLRMEEKSSEWEQRDSAGYSLPLLPDILSVFYSSKSDNSLNTLQTSAYIQDNLRLSGDFGYINASAGIRATYTGFNNEFIVSPRLQIGYVPSANTRWAFRFSTGLYHQTPFFKEIRKATEISSGEYVIELNKNIRSQRSLQFIFGSDFTFKALGRPFKLSAEAYYKALANVIPYEINNLKITYSGINESKGHIAGLDFKLFGQFVPGSDSWLSIGVLDSKEKLRGVSVPGPNDRRYNISLFFTDFFPKIPGLKVSLRGIFMDGLPQSSPHSTRDKGYFRTPPYKRVDIGAAYGLLTENRSARILPWIKSAWIGVDCFNLFDISNVGNYYWVSDVNNIEYAVPNYLTRRMLNLKLTLDF